MFQQKQHQQLTCLCAGELILVGRGVHCDIRLDDPSSSRVHCRLLERDGKVFLTDAGSRWGTYVNGVRVSECELAPGDKITIGETQLCLVVEEVARGRYWLLVGNFP
ncbi:MAG: FHA domain-containing protein [Planctomycetaceae bacterium]|nr:FHA domain-containing protein [Planctomycetaceae bacterium]